MENKDVIKIRKKILLIIILIIILLLSSSIVFYYLTKKEIKLSLNGSNKIALNYNQSLIDTGAKACYGTKLSKKCKDISDRIKTENNIVNGKLGKYKIIYEIELNGIKKEIIRYVDIVDKDKPIITLEDTKSNTFCPGEKFIDPGYTAYDEYDGDITDKVVVENKDNIITYIVKDSSGNITIEKREALYIDKINPSIKLKGSNVTYVYLGSSFNEPGYTATDNCSGNITNKVEVTGTVDSNTIGDYTLTYTVSDNSGNRISVNRTIKVIDKIVNETITPTEKTIYLTFDDGPSPYTGKLLDILASYNVKVTFFVVCKSTTYDKYLVRAYNEGHSIGIHSCSHVWKTIYSSIDGFFNDLNIISDKVYNLTGKRTELMRFPGGSSNTISTKYSRGIMTSLSYEVEQRGYKYFDWTIASGDTNTKSTQQVINNVTSRIKGDSYYVVLQHDIKNYSVDAVEAIIKDGLSKGYTFAPLTINSPIVHAKVAN